MIKKIIIKILRFLGLNKIIRSLLHKVVIKLSDLANLASIGILLDKYGNYKSHYYHQSIDADGAPIPWFTYPAIDYLKQLDWREKTVFEYGSGNSSAFFAKRVKHLTSVEHDIKWFEQNKKQLLKNQTITFADKPTEYIHAIENTKTTFDLIIVDGIHRPECVKIALKYLKTNGCLVFDNADWYPNTCEFLRENNLIQIDFHGFGPINQYTWTTSLFLTRSFDSSPLNKRQPIPSIAAINHIFD
jgi:hypothetical protein